MNESRQGKFGGASATADFVFGFEHDDRAAGARDGNRGGKTIRA
jgi:hypothetical protein